MLGLKLFGALAFIALCLWIYAMVRPKTKLAKGIVVAEHLVVDEANRVASAVKKAV